MNNNRQTKLITRGGVLVSALLASSVYAQTASDVSGASARAEIEEVMVTARRRDESLANVPIAVSAIGGEQLNERQVRTDSDLQMAVPGLTIRQTQGNNSLTYSIRGQSADTFSGSPSAVIAYMNEVPLTIGSASSFYDLASVQALKGPQGTLFGRNATGGAVLYTSAKPSIESEAMLKARAGNFNLRELEGMVNIPLVGDTVLLRIAANALERDGYIDNLYNGDELGELDRQSGRVSLSFAPNDRYQNTTVAQYSRIGGTNTGASYTYSVYSCGDTNNGVPLNCGAGLLFGPGLDSITYAGAWNDYLAAHPKAYAPGLIAYVDEQRRMGPYKTRHAGDANHDGRDWLISNTTTFEISDTLSLKNILGASHSSTDSEQPQSGAPFVTILTANAAAGQSGNELVVDSFSEEFQLQGTAFNEQLNYIVGVYIQRMTSDTLWPQTYFDVAPVMQPAYVTNAFSISNETDALYAQGSYDLAGLTGVEALTLTAGLRYTWERVEIEQLDEATYTASLPNQKSHFHDPSWELGLEYQASDSTLAYLKTRGSFRSGGFNGAAPPVNANATGGGNEFESEHVKDIELGFKFRGSVADMPAMLNIALYQQWVDDVQRVEFPDPDGPGGLASIAVTANVPEEVVKGVEVEASILPVSWLELGLSGAFTDAEFTDGKINLFGTPYSYGPVGDTPESSGVAYLQINVPTSDTIGQISVRTEVYAQSAQYFSNAADSVAPGTKLPSYELVNARLSWEAIMGSPFNAALFGKNVADEEYFAGGMTLAAALGHNAAAVGEPRTFGMEVSYQF